jgi:predicted choloylglycine hydrolase
MSEPIVQETHQATAKSKRRKRILIWCAALSALAIAITAYGLRDYVRTLNSLRRIPGTNAYVIDYYADYKIDEVRAHGIDIDNAEESYLRVYFPKVLVPIARWLNQAYFGTTVETIPTDGKSCSTVVLCQPNGAVYFGRNLDYEHDACLIVKVHRPELPATVAVLDLDYVGLNRDDLDTTSLLDRLPLLFAPYYLEDGMNEHGVAVADMTVENIKPPYDPARPNIIHATAMRLILDYAKSVDEAVKLLGEYNVHFVQERCHLMIADAAGKSAVVEFIDGNIRTTSTEDHWQVSTNHQIYGKTEQENDQACWRYRTASDMLAKLSDRADAGDVMKIMQAVQQGSTMWTSVYNLSTGEFRFSYRQHYADPYMDRIASAFGSR